jgi:hypothetical protein
VEFEVEVPDEVLLGATAWVTVREPDRPELLIRLGYAIRQEGPALVGFSVSPAGEPDAASLSSAGIRSLPVSRWDRSARAALGREIDRQLGGAAIAVDQVMGMLQTVLGDLSPEDQGRPLGELRELLASRLQAAAGARRRVRSIGRLEAVAQEYRANLAAGLPDPVASIARAHDVQPATARSWVYRARKAGLLGPAVGSARAGELPRSVDRNSAGKADQPPKRRKK